MKKFKLKSLLCFTKITALCLTMIVLFAVVGCDKTPKYDIYENHDISACGVNDPLRNIEWIKEFVDGLEQNAKAGYKHHARIYLCDYKDGMAFLIEPCVQCPDAGYVFRNCEGEGLCGGGGHSGIDNCSEFNIDFENKMLVWEIKPL